MLQHADAEQIENVIMSIPSMFELNIFSKVWFQLILVEVTLQSPLLIRCQLAISVEIVNGHTHECIVLGSASALAFVFGFL